MARLAHALKHEVIPAWNRFIGEVLPAGQVSDAARALRGDRADPDFAMGSVARSLRRIANADIYPNPEAIWEAAEGARHLPNHAWCAGPLLLFAAARFELFSITMLGAPYDMITPGRKSQLLSSAVGAVEPSIDDFSFEPVRRKLFDNGADDLAIARQMKKFLRRPHGVVVGDRAVWSLAAIEESGFQLAWERRTTFVANAASTAARLAENNADIGLTFQRQIAIAAIRDVLARSGTVLS